MAYYQHSQYSSAMHDGWTPVTVETCWRHAQLVLQRPGSPRVHHAATKVSLKCRGIGTAGQSCLHAYKHLSKAARTLETEIRIFCFLRRLQSLDIKNLQHTYLAEKSATPIPGTEFPTQYGTSCTCWNLDHHKSAPWLHVGHLTPNAILQALATESKAFSDWLNSGASLEIKPIAAMNDFISTIISVIKTSYPTWTWSYADIVHCMYTAARRDASHMTQSDASRYNRMYVLGLRTLTDILVHDAATCLARLRNGPLVVPECVVVELEKAICGDAGPLYFTGIRPSASGLSITPFSLQRASVRLPWLPDLTQLGEVWLTRDAVNVSVYRQTPVVQQTKPTTAHNGQRDPTSDGSHVQDGIDYRTMPERYWDVEFLEKRTVNGREIKAIDVFQESSRAARPLQAESETKQQQASAPNQFISPTGGAESQEAALQETVSLEPAAQLLEGPRGVSRNQVTERGLENVGAAPIAQPRQEEDQRPDVPTVLGHTEPVPAIEENVSGCFSSLQSPLSSEIMDLEPALPLGNAMDVEVPLQPAENSSAIDEDDPAFVALYEEERNRVFFADTRDANDPSAETAVPFTSAMDDLTATGLLPDWNEMWDSLDGFDMP